MFNIMTEQYIDIEGIRYFTLVEKPQSLHLTKYVLLTHALLSNYHMWDSTVLALHKVGYTTIRYDHIGHNLTDPPQDPHYTLTMDDLTRHAHQIVHALTGQHQLDAVVGCSIGGVLALRYGMLFPHDVDLVASIAPANMVTTPPFRQLWTDRVALFDRSPHDLAHLTVWRWQPRDDDPARARALELAGTCTLQGYRLLAGAFDYDFRGEVGRLEAVGKVWIAVGSEDQSCDVRHLREVFGDARVRVLEGAGHLPSLQMPEVLEGMLLEEMAR